MNLKSHCDFSLSRCKGTMKNNSFQRLWQILHRVVATATSFCDRVGEVPLMSVAKAAKTLLRGLALEAITRILGTIMR